MFFFLSSLLVGSCDDRGGAVKCTLRWSVGSEILLFVFFGNLHARARVLVLSFYGAARRCRLKTQRKRPRSTADLPVYGNTIVRCEGPLPSRTHIYTHTLTHGLIIIETHTHTHTHLHSDRHIESRELPPTDPHTHTKRNNSTIRPCNHKRTQHTHNHPECPQSMSAR